MKRTYSPVALVVDDDPNILRRVQRGILQDTSLGFLRAADLSTAAGYLQDLSLKIDVVLTDIGFADGTDAPALKLYDGLDLVEYASLYRPDSPVWMLSVLADDRSFSEQAKKRNLRIERWFQKIGSQAAPWAVMEREYLLKVLKRDKAFRAQTQAGLKIDLTDFEPDIEHVENIRKAIRFPRLTYLTQLPPAYKLTVRKPIEVRMWQTDDGTHVATAPDLGLIAQVEGETAEEALEHLGDLIAKEFLALDQERAQIRAYARYVDEKLNEFVAYPSAPSDAEKSDA